MLFFLCFSVLKNDEAASMNIYVICMWHSTRNLRCRITNPFFFARFFPFLFVSFFCTGSVSTILHVVTYICIRIYTWSTFSLFFFHLYSQRNKKKKVRMRLHFIAIARCMIETKWKWEQQKKKKTFRIKTIQYRALDCLDYRIKYCLLCFVINNIERKHIL